MKNKIIAVVGPTGIGKTEVVIKLAMKINGEIVNCDSRQVYKKLDIGTNKGLITKTPEFENLDKWKIFRYELEKSGIYGWLFDIVEPNEQLSLSEYQKITLLIIAQIYKMGKIPILVGGTGLYFDALIKGYKLSNIKPNFQLREELAKLNVKELFTRLIKLSPEKASKLNNSDAHNPRRLIRAIEEAQVSQKERNQFEILDTQCLHQKHKIDIEPFIIYPIIDREKLYKKVDARVLAMVAEGLVQETTKIVDEYTENLEVLRGIGYKEVILYLHEKITLAEMIAKIQQGHKNYIKRQVTWFESGLRKYKLQVYDFEKDTKKIFKDVEKFLGNRQFFGQL